MVLTSRDQHRGQTAIEALLSDYPNASVAILPLDLSRAASVDAFADTFAKRFGYWDLLVNNAGAKVLPFYTETDSGIEYHFGVNAVGHFAITSDLMTHRAKSARVVSVASIVARFAPLRMGPAGSDASYSPAASYSASKLSNLLFGLELQNRFGSASFSSVVAHPGFARAEPYGSKSAQLVESLLAQSAANGALPIIEAASDSKISGGSYIGPKVLELWGKPTNAKLPTSCSPENLAENWSVLERLSGRTLAL